MKTPMVLPLFSQFKMDFSSLTTSSKSHSGTAAFTLFRLCIKTFCWNLVSDLSSYLSCFGLNVRMLARNCKAGTN